jgi:hypothetical protein
MLQPTGCDVARGHSSRVAALLLLSTRSSIRLQGARRCSGWGEATHGSREFGDARLVLTQRAIERGGYRIVALEESADRMARLNDYIDERAATPAEIVGGAWWIGRRTQRQLIPWLRDWNRRHPSDRVTLIGVDPQNFFLALPEVRDFLLRAYGERRGIAAAWSGIERELAAADSQTFAFGNSRVDTLVRRQLFELSGALQLDAPILRRLYGDSAYERSAAALSVLAEFADFNGGQSGGIVMESRDWYMAAHMLLAVAAPGSEGRILGTQCPHRPSRRATTRERPHRQHPAAHARLRVSGDRDDLRRGIVRGAAPERSRGPTRNRLAPAEHRRIDRAGDEHRVTIGGDVDVGMHR